LYRLKFFEYSTPVLEVKHVITISILLLVGCLDVLGQNKGALIRQQLGKWQSRIPKHQVDVFFNQSKYSPGDTVYFNSYYLDEQGGRVPGRQILHLLLFNCTGKQIIHINFFVRNGTGFNQLVLPDTLKPGLYEADLYSDWMKNFNRSIFTHQKIEVVDRNQIAITAAGSDERVSFFPEGGSLVAGVTNRVVVRAQDISSTNADLVGGNGLITSFSLDHAGMGVVVFTPEAGKNYAVHINEKLYSLPPPVTEKLSVLLTPREDRKPLKIIVGSSPGSTIRNEDLSLFIVSQGNTYASTPITFGEKDFVQFNVPQNNLPAGPAELWVLDSKGRTVASRVFPVADSARVIASVKAAPSPVNRRGKVAAELSLTDASGNPIEGEFAVSVVTESLFAKNLPEGKQKNFAFENMKSFEEWDKWLVTQSSYGYDWEKVVAEDPPAPLYWMGRYFHKRGVAFDATTGVPVSDSVKISGFFLKNTNGYEAYTNKDGEFDFVFLFDLWDNDELFYSADRKGIEQKNVRIKWIEENDHSPLTCATRTEQADDYGIFSVKKRMIDRSYNFYTKPQRPATIPENPNEVLEDELTDTNVSINIHDYILFPTMAETIREVIPMLKHRIVKGKSIVRAYINPEQYIPTGDPLYIIDGVITRDTELFLSLVPDDVLTVKVVVDVDNLRALGSLGKNGVVFVHTKNLNAARLRSGTLLPVKGLSKPINFIAPDHSADHDSRQPDFKSTVFWAPALSVPPTGKKEFSFFASDSDGPLRITVHGITKDGRPFNAATTCNVVFDQLQK
jgi:hypothetical protein